MGVGQVRIFALGLLLVSGLLAVALRPYWFLTAVKRFVCLVVGHRWVGTIAGTQAMMDCTFCGQHVVVPGMKVRLFDCEGNDL